MLSVNTVKYKLESVTALGEQRGVVHGLFCIVQFHSRGFVCVLCVDVVEQ